MCVMRATWRHALTKKVQRIFWIYLTKNFVVSSLKDFRMVGATIQCLFIPIKADNFYRVGEFRESTRIPEYRDKVAKGEIGFFSEYNGKAIGSIWATINRTRAPLVARMYMQLMPNEALIHDIVTNEQCRGKSVGPFMVSRMASHLLSEDEVSRVIIDVSVKNGSSLRMMDKVGLQAQDKVLYISLAGKLAFQKRLRDYRPA